MRHNNLNTVLAILFIFLLASLSNAKEAINNGSSVYLSNTIIIKLKSTQQHGYAKVVQLNTVVTNAMEPYGIESAESYLPFKTKVESTLNNIIKIEYSSKTDPHVVASKLSGLDDVEWAEPKYLRQVDYIPNDPSTGNQYALNLIKAFDAWDISKGDSAIIIGIIDTGVDWDHPDLTANMWVNAGEIPGNGTDDDNNGYVDDVRGWDFGGLNGTPDNNPAEDNPYHGTHVAGIASAVSDNGVGVASIGYNCTIMPVKVAQDNYKNPSGQPYIVYGDEGIVYAVDNGARIINCSYGGGGYSILDQEIINYAVQNNVLIVAAAGNDDSYTNYYPASYKGVMSVASTKQDDIRSGFSNYGTEVDVSAPGQSIYGTWQNNTYASLSGTSMASPLTAGLAALVAAQFPTYTPDQIAEQIRTNADDIRAKNTSIGHLLGRGRINAFNALNNVNSISVRGIDFNFSDAVPGGNGNGILESGETISIGVKFVNYLNHTTGLSISLQSMTSGASILNGIITPGSIATLDSFDNYESRFTVSLSNSLGQNAEVLFLLNYSDGSYSDFQAFNTIVNPVYATQTGNDVSLTISSNGKLGFNDFPSNLQGSGFHYLDGTNLLFEGALILATSSTKISDAGRNANGSGQNNDFTVVEPFMLFPGAETGQQGRTVFNDDAAGTSKLGTRVTLTSYTYTDPPHNNYIVLNYNIANNSGSDITNLYTGLFFDWDMVEGSGADDITLFDDEGKLGYAYHQGGNPDTYVGIALISSEDYGFRGVVNPGTGLADQFKWQSISSGVVTGQAGPGDIFNFISGGPFSIDAGQNTDVAFALAAANNVEGIRTAIANARVKYTTIVSVEEAEQIPLTYSLAQNYPNPFNPQTNIMYEVADAGMVTLKVYDVIGKEVKSLVNDIRTPGRYEVSFDAAGLASGVYFYKLTAGNYTSTKKMIVLK